MDNQIKIKNRPNHNLRKKYNIVALVIVATVLVIAFLFVNARKSDDSSVFAQVKHLAVKEGQPKQADDIKADKESDGVQRTHIQHHSLEADPTKVADEQNRKLMAVTPKGQTPTRNTGDVKDINTNSKRDEDYIDGSNIDESSRNKTNSSQKGGININELPLVKHVEHDPNSELTQTLVTPTDEIKNSGSSLRSNISGSELDAKNSIIMSESSNNTRAENGRYAGLGQLDKSYYPVLIGKTWDEVKDDRNAQLVAMDKYVAGRYGTYAKALDFRKVHDWY